MVSVTYREGDCWSVVELDEFSIAGVRPEEQYDIDTHDGEGTGDNQYQITVDGRFGKETYEAVVLFQKQQGLVPDGIVGPKTWTKLYAPERPCDMPRKTALALGATEREANFVAKVAFQESRCHLHQVVDRPSTRDYSWGPYGVNYYGSLMARVSTYGKPEENIRSWKSATLIMLTMGRRTGWCHWIKNPGGGQFYCSGGSRYQAGDQPPVVEAP